MYLALLLHVTASDALRDASQRLGTATRPRHSPAFLFCIVFLLQLDIRLVLLLIKDDLANRLLVSVYED